MIAGGNHNDSLSDMGRPRRRASADREGGRPVAAAERALFTRRRKEIYEALHPETKATQNASKDRKTSDNLSFVSETAANTGRDQRSVQRVAARGSIGDDLADEAKAAPSSEAADKHPPLWPSNKQFAVGQRTFVLDPCTGAERWDAPQALPTIHHLRKASPPWIA